MKDYSILKEYLGYSFMSSRTTNLHEDTFDFVLWFVQLYRKNHSLTVKNKLPTLGWVLKNLSAQHPHIGQYREYFISCLPDDMCSDLEALVNTEPNPRVITIQSSTNNQRKHVIERNLPDA